MKTQTIQTKTQKFVFENLGKTYKEPETAQKFLAWINKVNTSEKRPIFSIVVRCYKLRLWVGYFIYFKIMPMFF